MAWIRPTGLVAGALMFAMIAGQAGEQSESLSMSGLAAAALQCLTSTRDTDASDICRVGAPFQPELDYRVTTANTLHLKLGFAAGHGLGNESPLLLSSWAADLENDVRGVNGTRRNYILTAWWRGRFEVATGTGLAVTLGLVDATDYLDNNAYANDEYTQFMNEALVNGPNAFLPSYDPGGAVALEMGDWSISGVAMRVKEDTADGHFGFLGGQLAYRMTTPWGLGTYRLLVTNTRENFLDPVGDASERRVASLLSFDQQLGKDLGAFLRIGWQAQETAAGYRAIYSGGIDLKGSRWGRIMDNIGLAFAHLDGDINSVDQTQVVEFYYRWVAFDSLAVTADLQYMRDDPPGPLGPSGLVLGTRFVVEF